MAINGLTGKEETFISVEEGGTKTRTDSFYTRLQIEYYVSQDQRTFDRSVYTFWSVLGDIGGLSGILVSVVSTLLNVLNFNKPENHMASRLYKPTQD